MYEIDKLGPIILFDGMCNLCSSSVQFIIKRDKKNQFRFASLQSAVGQELLKAFNYSVEEMNSFVLVKKGKIYSHSTAALMVARELSGGWRLLSIFMMVPTFIRDKIYKFIAANRYKWFGKKSECWLPSPNLRSRFID